MISAPSSRIIFVNRFFAPDHSATSQILSDLAVHLARQGRCVSVITSRGLYDDPSIALPKFEVVQGVDVHRVFRPRFGRKGLIGRALDYLAMYFLFAAALRRLARSGDFVIAKTDPPMLSVALAPVAKLRGAHLINWLQDLYPEVALGLGMRMLAPIAPFLIALRQKSLEGAACNVAIGERMRERLENSGIDSKLIEVIPNWCNDEQITPKPVEQNYLRNDWGLDKKFVVGYSGNLGRAHDCDTIINAAERLRDENDIVFLFIGGGHLTKYLKTEVERLNLNQNFLFKPYQSIDSLSTSLGTPNIHWISLLPAMEGLIVPSKFYGIVAAGRATLMIGDPEGELGALIAQEGCGITIPPGADKELADAILSLKQDFARLCEMEKKARAMLDKRFTKKLSLNRWSDLLDNLKSSTSR
jgi:colanic acid biosynthesis glycosyl transferase WcaI